MSGTLKIMVELTYSDDPKNTQTASIKVGGRKSICHFGSNTPVTLHGHLVRELNWIVADWQASRRRNAEENDE